MSVVNTNVSASLAQSALMRNERALGSAMEQLSTGSKINSASDDAAGLAMAAKFTSQIKGLDMAVKNANDGVSMISTAEGALNEVTNMLQRMRELAVQSSNGTMTQEDRNYMDKEYKALDSEIDRIEKNTQWNSTNILDGSVGSSGKVSFQVSSNYVSKGQTTTGELVVHDSIIGKTQDEVAAAGTFTGTGTASGDAHFNYGDTFNGVTLVKDSSTNANDSSTPPVLGFAHNDIVDKTLAEIQATNNILKNEAGTGQSAANATGTAQGVKNYKAGDTFDGITLKAGETEVARTNDTITVDFGNLGTDTASLGDVLTQSKAQTAIGTLDTAIKNVNEQRATFGAASNRLTHAVDNMTNIRVNAEASRSRIEDTDYAKTTSELAKAQIIAQAGTAMLAQANQSAQSVLSLLR